MPKRKPARPAIRRAAGGDLRLTGIDVLPEGTLPAAAAKKYAHRYTTGPFQLPPSAGTFLAQMP